MEEAGPTERWIAPDLEGCVAVVTGATRGVGQGVATVLSECGSQVYVVGRSTRSSTSQGSAAVEDVADRILKAGGRAIPAPCDLTDDASVSALVERITYEQGRIDILVNNAVGWRDEADVTTFAAKPPWEAPDGWWNANFQVGVRSHWFLTRRAAPLMIASAAGVVLFTSERIPETPGSVELVLDLRATVIHRMTLLFARHFGPHQVASVLLYPGFVRTPAILNAFQRGHDYFAGWTRDDFYAQTASPQYAGRAAASLAADPDIMTQTGTLITAHEAACTYAFTDVTGLRPDPP